MSENACSRIVFLIAIIKNVKGNCDDFAKSPISALRTISEESHVRLSTLNSPKIAQALILDYFQSRLISNIYRFINCQ